MIPGQSTGEIFYVGLKTARRLSCAENTEELGQLWRQIKPQRLDHVRAEPAAKKLELGISQADSLQYGNERVYRRRRRIDGTPTVAPVLRGAVRNISYNETPIPLAEQAGKEQTNKQKHATVPSANNKLGGFIIRYRLSVYGLIDISAFTCPARIVVPRVHILRNEEDLAAEHRKPLFLQTPSRPATVMEWGQDTLANINAQDIDLHDRAGSCGRYGKPIPAPSGQTGIRPLTRLGPFYSPQSIASGTYWWRIAYDEMRNVQNYICSIRHKKKEEVSHCTMNITTEHG